MEKCTTEDIDRYIHNEMSPSEKQQWDKEIKSDKKLDKEIKLHEEIEEAIREKDIIRLRKTLSEIIKTGYSQEKNNNYHLKEPSRIAAMS